MPVSVKEVVFDSAVSDIQVQGWCSFAGGGGVAGISGNILDIQNPTFPTLSGQRMDMITLKGFKWLRNQLCFFFI